MVEKEERGEGKRDLFLHQDPFDLLTMPCAIDPSRRVDAHFLKKEDDKRLIMRQPQTQFLRGLGAVVEVPSQITRALPFFLTRLPYSISRCTLIKGRIVLSFDAHSLRNEEGLTDDEEELLRTPFQKALHYV